jgi:hypothetical protein
MSRRRRSSGVPPADRRFWGSDDTQQATTAKIRPTPDPGALPRSLGNPPLAVSPSTARRHLDAVYEEAVRAATALAAANGLLDTEYWEETVPSAPSSTD